MINRKNIKCIWNIISNEKMKRVNFFSEFREIILVKGLIKIRG